jgi:serpin B
MRKRAIFALLALMVVTVVCAKKTITSVKGNVCDEAGPLMGATVCEINSKGRIVESAITDMNGAFRMKVKDPQDRLRISYVGMKTVIVPINKKKYKIKMKSATKILDVQALRRKTACNLPIPTREITHTIDMTEFEAIGIENDNEGVSNENNPRRDLHLSDEELTMVTPVNDLAFKMIRKVGTTKSVLLSSLGMTYALGLINNGAVGETKQQINKVLGCNNADANNINSFCHKILTEAPTLDRLTQMDINNVFFSQKGYKPKSDFVKIADEYYRTELNSLDFGSEKSVDEINQKISQHSKGMIPQVLDKSNLNPTMGFVLMNTIYFKGIWTDKFHKANTQDETFKGEDGKETTMPMMNQKGKFLYTENELCQTLCLPYSNGAFQMIVLLPKEGKTVSEVAQSLSADSWEKMDEEMRRVYVDVKLPRFETLSDVVLTGVMKALGMPDAFSITKADFSNLFDMDTYIGMIKQTGRIKVDETGTEASVVTALQGRITGLDLVKPDTIRFYATHPFLYFIRECSTGTIFFIGQYMGT